MRLFFNMICRVGIFMICAQAILYFRPNKTYEKYMKLLAEIMVVVQIFTWVSGTFKKGAGEDFVSRVGWFSEKLEDGLKNGRGIDISGTEELLEEVEQVQKKMLEEGLREQGAAEDAPREPGDIKDAGEVEEIRKIEEIEDIRIDVRIKD